MPNGDDKNRVRVCLAIDGFRSRYGRWPARVCLPPDHFENLVRHILIPAGFALVSTMVEIVSDDNLTENVAIVAEGVDGPEFRYGDEEGSDVQPEPDAMSYFGHAIFRSGLQ